MRLAIRPGVPRTPAQEACIREEQRREAIFEAVVKLRCGDWEYFDITFDAKPFDELPQEDQERIAELGVTTDEYHLWHATHFAWKSQQNPNRVPLADFIDDVLLKRPAAA